MLTPGLFEGRSAWLDALREALLQACASEDGGGRELLCLDADFTVWPWSDSDVLASVGNWGRRPGRRLHMLARQYEDLRLQQPRFLRWRTLFDHCIDARAYEPEAAARLGFASALVVQGGSQALSVRLFDTQKWRGAVSQTPLDGLRTREIFDALKQRSEPSFVASTFGL